MAENGLEANIYDDEADRCQVTPMNTLTRQIPLAQGVKTSHTEEVNNYNITISTILATTTITTPPTITKLIPSTILFIMLTRRLLDATQQMLSLGCG